MRVRANGLFFVLALALATGCESRQSVETEIYIYELQAQVSELETQLDYFHNEVVQLSREVSARVQNMALALEDVNRRVFDLPTGDPQLTIREVEAAMSVANQRLAELRTAANNLATSVDY
jgi:outer membrane murein-binding lipoprotein Lpp